MATRETITDGHQIALFIVGGLTVPLSMNSHQIIDMMKFTNAFMTKMKNHTATRITKSITPVPAPTSVFFTNAITAHKDNPKVAEIGTMFRSLCVSVSFFIFSMLCDFDDLGGGQ